MAKIVIAGSADCPYYGRVELLADSLAANLSDFKLHKIVKQPAEWETWLKETCEARGWKHNKSPIIWRELVDRGGKGMLIGGSNDFQEYAVAYYGQASDLSGGDMKKVASENLDTKIEVDEEDREWRSRINPTRMCVTNACSPACYSMVDVIANGEFFGPDTDVALTLYDKEENQTVAEGIAMDAFDLARPLLRQVSITSNLTEAVKDCSLIILLDEVEQDKEETKEEWYKRNNEVFTNYAKVINEEGRKDVKVIVAGQGPVNFNAYMMLQNAPKVPRQNIVALSRVVENHAKSVLAEKLAVNSSCVVNVVAWGNTHGTLYVDTSMARVHEYDGAIWGPPSFSRPLREMVHDDKWINTELPELYAKRGKIEAVAMGHRPGASRAAAIATFVNHWWNGSPSGQIFSLGVASEGWYDVPEGLVFSFPVTLSPAGYWSVTEDVDVSEDTKAKLQAAVQDLLSEREFIYPPPKPPTPVPTPTEGIELTEEEVSEREPTSGDMEGDAEVKVEGDEVSGEDTSEVKVAGDIPSTQINDVIKDVNDEVNQEEAEEEQNGEQ